MVVHPWESARGAAPPGTVGGGGSAREQFIANAVAGAEQAGVDTEWARGWAEIQLEQGHGQYGAPSPEEFAATFMGAGNVPQAGEWGTPPRDVLEAQVRKAYLDVFGREPDPGGLAHHLAMLEAGVPLSELIEGMRRTPEGQEYAESQMEPAQPATAGVADELRNLLEEFGLGEGREMPESEPTALQEELDRQALRRLRGEIDPVQEDMAEWIEGLRSEFVSRGEIALERMRNETIEELRAHFERAGPGYETSTPFVTAVTELDEELMRSRQELESMASSAAMQSLMGEANAERAFYEGQREFETTLTEQRRQFEGQFGLASESLQLEELGFGEGIRRFNEQMSAQLSQQAFDNMYRLLGVDLGVFQPGDVYGAIPIPGSTGGTTTTETPSAWDRFLGGTKAGGALGDIWKIFGPGGTATTPSTTGGAQKTEVGTGSGWWY